MRTQLFGAVLIVAASAATPVASDRVAVYAIVDRVMLEPSAAAPETIQVWGVFSVAERNNANDYRPAARGYLYFSLGKDREITRHEWSDLKSVSGTGQIVAFGSRWEGTPRLRQTSETPTSPDRYVTDTGVTKVAGRTDYAPIRALVNFKP